MIALRGSILRCLAGTVAVTILVGACTTAQAEVASAPELAAAGQAWLQDARESADPSSLRRAEEAFVRLRSLDADDAEGPLGLAIVANARHDFRLALELGEEAMSLAPSSTRAMGTVFDALVELGRYDEAGAVLERMLRTRPDLGSYTRLSYYHELHGRMAEAVDAMERAVVAAGPVPENTEYARVLLGDLWFQQRATVRATGLYRVALDVVPGFVPALRGLARVAGATGDLGRAIELYQSAVERTPLPDLLIGLGDAQEAAGQADAARATFDLVSEIGALLRANGVNTDLDLALFEADHGDTARAVEMARAAYTVAPSIRAAHALAWALFRDGQVEGAGPYLEEARRTGWLDPTLRRHAETMARAAAQGGTR